VADLLIQLSGLFPPARGRAQPQPLRQPPVRNRRQRLHRRRQPHFLRRRPRLDVELLAELREIFSADVADDVDAHVPDIFQEFGGIGFLGGREFGGEFQQTDWMLTATNLAPGAAEDCPKSK
jgi:hypothetical protein